jgi:hypothetical protein
MTSELLPPPRKGEQLPAALEVDFSLVLVRTIESIKNDPSQLRNTIYELSRVKLQREALQQNPRMSILELRRMMLALETAIERVETHSSQQDESPDLRSATFFLEHRVRDAIDVSGQPATAQVISPSGLDSEAPIVLSPKRSGSWPRLGTFARVGGLVAIGVIATYALVGKYLPEAAMKPSLYLMRVAAPQVPAPVVQAQPQRLQSQSAGLPLPSVYGIYAVNHGQLYELEGLPGRVPDPRVFMSTPVKTPGHTLLPDGRVAFIVYRRDVAASAPERASVRVIAKVLRAMKFSAAGQVNTAAVDDQWTIRGTSYELRVAPLSENSEMLLLRPEKPDFVFPAGRYGLVIKGQAYDFIVAGRITDSAQCLESVEAANGNFYSECRPQ